MRSNRGDRFSIWQVAYELRVPIVIRCGRSRMSRVGHLSVLSTPYAPAACFPTPSPVRSAQSIVLPCARNSYHCHSIEIRYWKLNRMKPNFRRLSVTVVCAAIAVLSLPAVRAADPDPALTPDQTNPDPVLSPDAVPPDPVLTPDQTNPDPVLSPDAVPPEPALRP